MQNTNEGANNDHNIGRVYTKMSDNFSGQNNAKVSSAIESLNFFHDIKNSEVKDDSNLSYDHMYASNTENGELCASDTDCQTAESEVKFLREWLILHLDLIQQQNDEILKKDNTILVLQQENEMLKERISCMERGAPFQNNKFFNNHTSPHYIAEDFAEDMTQDSGPQSEEDNKDNIRLLDLGCGDENNCAVEFVTYESNHQLNNTAERLTENYNKPHNSSVDQQNEVDPQIKMEMNMTTDEKSDEKLRSDKNYSNSEIFNNILKLNNTNVMAHNNSYDLDPTKDLRMNIRRKRVCSNSSALSNNDSVFDERRLSRKLRRKRKRDVKYDKMLTCNEQYVTQTGEVSYGISNDQELALEVAAAASSDLEVPRWRVKVYTSCYTMEGTENLDDEVYNKRHSRLENDERRRKRWDIQRIREQRNIEKLKQRQERVNSGSKTDEHAEPVQSLWPALEDVRLLEVCDELPVSAFGCPIPHLSPSEFSLPWLSNPSTSVKKTTTKKSTVRRKASKR